MNTQKTSKLGLNGPEVFRLGLGCMGMSGMYGKTDDRESVATIQAALEYGPLLVDTGDFYGMGHNELLVGEAIRGRRDRAVVSVKFEALRGPDGAWLGSDASPVAVKTFAAYSLKRLGVDVIDVYRPARLDPGPDRGHRGRDQGFDSGRLRAAHRPLGGRRGDHPPRSGRAPDRRLADRILAGQSRPRSRRSFRCSRSSASTRPSTACSREGCSPAVSPRRGATFARTCRASAERRTEKTRAWRRRSPSSPRNAA